LAIPFADVLLCADSNCGTLCGNSSTNIILHSTWQIHFSSALLCADMNCGTLFEKSSTNINHFFPSSSFLCVLNFLFQAMGFVTLVYHPLGYFGDTFADVLLALPTKARILCLDSL
jgi:hypothetical protein